MIHLLIAIAVISPVIGCLMAWWYIGDLEQRLLWANTHINELMQDREKVKQPRGKNGRFVKKSSFSPVVNFSGQGWKEVFTPNNINWTITTYSSDPSKVSHK